MLLEYVDTDLNLQVLFGLALGLAFGVAAQISRFCLRRSVAGDDGVEPAGLSVWLLALATAIAGVQLMTAAGFIDLGDHRYLSSSIPVAAIALGGLAFGAGMVLTRGCVTRLTVLSATGNLRAITVLAIFAITAHATIKGVFAPLRTTLGNVTVEAPMATLAAIPGMSLAVPLALLVSAVWLALRARTSWAHLFMGVAIGLLVVVGWAGTSTLLFDEFDPAPVQSLAFTLPWTDTLFWSIASTAIPAGFGTGLIGGVISGAFVSALLRSELSLVSFSEPRETLRYGAGGVLMGAGGVLAGGCTIGAGLSGVSTLSLSAALALGAIVIGALLTRQLLRGRAPIGALA